VVNNNPAQFYVPNGKSEEFIKMVGANKCFVNMFVGANGTSKTSTGANILANIVFGVQNDWFQHPLFQEWPYIKKGRIISDPTTLKEKIIPELQKWFPKNEAEHLPAANYETAKEGKNYISTFTTKNGWEIDLMSSEQEVKEFESVDLGFVWIDEPIPKAQFMATVARGRLGMIMIWTFTPLTYSAWIKNWLDEHSDGQYADYVEATMEDNCFVEGTEYLAKDGWRLLEEAKIGDVVATVNFKTLKIEYQKVIDVVKREYNGDVLHLYAGIKSTPNHRIVGRFDGQKDFEIREAKDLYRGVRMLGSAKEYKGNLTQSPFPNRFNINDWAEFLGWYISEGCTTGVKGGKDKNSRVYISQNRGKNFDEIRGLLIRMGFKVCERAKDLGFSDKDVHNHLLPLGSCREKYIPDYVFEYPRLTQELFYKAMVKGDGDGKNRYFTTSKQLADDLQRLLVIMGVRSSIKIQGKEILYRVHRIENEHIYINHKPKPEKYKGIVSCVSVPNGIIIVRSDKKKPLVVGNCSIHGVRGFFKHEHIQRMFDAFPEDEKQARVFGKFGHLLGRVHKAFKRKIHVIKAFPLREKDYTTYMALDPHPRVGDHVLYMSVDRKGRKIITGEIISQGLVRDLAARMKSFEASMNYRIEARLIDPSAYNDDQHREDPSVGSQLFDLGFNFIKGSKDLMAGIKRTNDALDYEVIEGKFIREPEVFIFDSCLVAIKQIEEYVWSEWKGPSKDSKELNATPKDINDHQPENLHRLLLSEPVFIPYQARNDIIPEPEDPDPYDPY